MTGLNLLAALPEILLACGAMALLMVGVFRQDETAETWAHWGALLLLVLCAAIAAGAPDMPETAAFGAFVSDPLSRFAKVLIFIGSAAALVLSRDYMRRIRLQLFEFPVLILFAALGMAMMVSSDDLISLYVGLELQSLSLYVLAAFRRDSVRSTESGLKYFVLGALASGLLLFGSSFVYGFAGTTRFEGIAAVVAAGDLSVGALIGLSLVITGLAFKISAAPFHMWTPDVYEGAPTPITALFATAPKVAAGALFLRVLYDPFGAAVADWKQIIAFLSAASMLVGGIAALGQTNIKRLMAYSSIGHMGFAMTGLAAGTEAGAQGVLIYLAVYLLMNIGVFAFILSMRRNGLPALAISDLAGLWKRDSLAAIAIAVLMFSLAGIPPLAGFFAKFYVFRAAADAGLVWLLVVAAIAAVISAFYYLRIVKIMFFDEPEMALDPGGAIELRGALMLSAALMLLFVIGGFGIPDSAAEAAAALMAR